MTYEELFAKCRTVGECRRMKVTQLDKATSDIQRWEIKKAYKERVAEIRQYHGTAKVVFDEDRADRC